VVELEIEKPFPKFLLRKGFDFLEETMRVLLVVLLSTMVWAADFPAVATVVSQQFIHTTESNRRETEIRVGPRIYTADSICRKASVGQEYPARLEGNHLVIQVGAATCKYRLVGQKMAK
jgi:hypothetical protein